MSRVNPPSLNRERPDTVRPRQVDIEEAILNVIKRTEDLGISEKDIKQETKLSPLVVKKSIDSLLKKTLIKQVVNVQNKRKKHYMANEFEPSKEISGGKWYINGELNKELIEKLRQFCLTYIRARNIATLEGINNEWKKKGAEKVSSQEFGEILYLMVLDNDIVEVKSTGLAEYRSFPIGTVCYSVSKGPRIGAFAAIPCGVCPRISLCTPDGVISPSTCRYFAKWLDIDF
ncbi:RNA polymerase III, subunit C34 [Handroanthus impetiginosus]|uniref:RNA polymerase III, subunit C34 n=1 Tax=Handroanthus impetiginosus TaxID=429701 RepID=A0A2G9HM60_9LAMI|nr:RNA polymerase III, subunit C34 [Handroanthus impetiginosus]